MTSPPAELAQALALVRRGNLAGARRLAESGLAAHPSSAPLLGFLGVLSCREGRLADGAGYLRRALAADPADIASRVNLARALADAGFLEEVAAVTAVALPPGRAGTELARLRGYAIQQQGDLAGAVAAYERVVADEPADWGTWNNLGNARRAAGRYEAAVEALARARRLRPDIAVIHRNFALAAGDAGRLNEAAAAVADAVRIEPANPDLLFEQGTILQRLGRLDEAEAGFRAAAKARPGFADAWLQLGVLLEHSNRLDELSALLAAAGQEGVSEEALAYLHALSLQRQGRLDEALRFARLVPESHGLAQRAHLIGKIADRLGDRRAAFAAFREMNRIEGEGSDALASAAAYRARVDAIAALVTPEFYASWRPAPPAPGRPAPVFLVGFPRSGTTLLDTVLMGHPDLLVLEEEPVLQAAADALGEYARLAQVDAAEVERLRNAYFQRLDEIAPTAGARVVVDKLPLNIVATPLIHRIFPDARFIFAQRDPFDVVLSCFMQYFRINDAMAAFLDLGEAARLYDSVLTLWSRCRNVFPLRVHTVRYEALVADVEAEVRPLIDFIGLPWDEGLLDHRRTAAARGHIKTPSYAQVSEPLYGRASGRWTRYREEMAEVVPILAPWAERLAYKV